MKKIGRRKFLKILAGVPVHVALSSNRVFAASRRYGKLVDTTRCIGCKRCMSACKRWNKLEVERTELLTDWETDLSANNWVVVNLRADIVNRERRLYHHWTCQHCERPACVGVCPVTAISKLPVGPVVIDENKCIGCRYCFHACPFKIPRFDFKKRVTRKCTLCYDRTPLLNYMQPACVAACPVAAISFGYKDAITREAMRRVEQNKNARYIMGLKEAGGTDVLTILPGKPDNFGLIAASDKVVNHWMDKIRITASGFMGASVIAGAMWAYSELNKTGDDLKR